MRFAVTRRINATPAQVFAVFTDLSCLADRVTGIASCEILTDEPVGVGTRFKETRVMLGKASSETMTITAFDPPRSYTTQAESCGAQYTTVFTFEPDNGGTRVTMNFHARPVKLLAKLTMPLGALMVGPLKKMVVKDLDDLAAVCESMTQD